MSPQRWKRSISAVWPWGGRREPATGSRRRRRPFIEPMESRQLLSTIAEFPVTSGDTFLEDIVAGPDGNLWFTDQLNDKVGTINTTTHVITEFSTGTVSNTGPRGITAGPDGNLWFTEPGLNKIGTINPTTHAIADFPVLTATSSPSRIAVGPDHKLWFTEELGNKVGVLDPTTHAVSELPVLTANADPDGIVAGLDGNLWFTEATANKIGMINPATHVVTEFSAPTAGSLPTGITAGPGGIIWFTERNAGKIGSIDPATHVIVETSVPPGGSEPEAITTGPDQNLWFADLSGNGIGWINPVTRGIGEMDVPTADARPNSITTGPDGNLWFAEIGNPNVGVLMPTLNIIATAEPPAFVAPNAPFGLTVNVTYQTGIVDTAFGGVVTLALVNPGPGGAVLGGSLTVAAKNGVATFTGLSISQAGSSRIMASTDPLTTTLTTPMTVAVPPTIVAEKALFAGKGRRRHVIGFELDFSTAIDSARAKNLANYMLTQSQRRGRQIVNQSVGFQAAYDAAAHRVTLTLAGLPKFTQGGKLVVVAKPPGGLTDAAGAPLDGSNQGTFGDDGTFVIAPRGSGISR